MLSIIIYLYWSAFYLTIFLGGRLIFFFSVPKSCYTEESQQIQYGKDFPVKKTDCMPDTATGRKEQEDSCIR